jgi:hypothetical protein
VKQTNINLTALTLGLTLLIAGGAQAQKPKKPASKPAAAKPAAAKPIPPKKAPSGPIVLGTEQLPGDFGQFGQTYTIGKFSPINFTLKSAEYSVLPVTMGRNTYAAKVDEKILLLHYVVHNPLPKEQSYDWSSIRFTVVDAKDQNHEFITCVGREGTTEPVSMSLKPAQKLDVYAAIIVPAEGVTPKLMVEREKGAPVVRYDLRGKVAPLAAPYADAADTTGMTAAPAIPAKAGQFYATGAFEMRLDSVSYTNEPLLRRDPGKGNRWVTAVFTIKNRTNGQQRIYWADFLPELKDADGEKAKYTQALLKATRDEVASGELAPGEEARIRFFFAVPSNVDAKTLKLSEGLVVDARVARPYIFDLTTATAVPAQAASAN